MTIPYSWGGVFNRDWLFRNLCRCFIHNSLSLSCLYKLQQIYTREQMNVTFCEPPEAHQFSNTRFWMGRRYLSPAGPLISECCFAQHCIDDRATSARSITTSYCVLFYYEPNISTVVCINLFSLPVVNTQLTEPHVGFLIWEKQHYKHTILYIFTVISVMLLTPPDYCQHIPSIHCYYNCYLHLWDSPPIAPLHSCRYYCIRHSRHCHTAPRKIGFKLLMF